ncbi:conserved oligomeric complex COG6 domain-containing protein [Sarocladium implicatum]|nr:conserved oligomeric complex COG6 domain-containing protein [Sarocladium implicatum]
MAQAQGLTIDLPVRDGLGAGSSSPQPPVSSGTPRSGAPFVSKATSILSSSYSDAEFRDALSLLDERHVQNDAGTRRRLRLDLQKEVINSNGEIVAEFGRVAEQLKRIRATLQKLNANYEIAKTEITKAHQDTSTAMTEAQSLLAQQKGVTTKQELLSAVRSHFTMTEDELAALTLTAEPVDDRFFNALSKAKKISRDCEVLLGFENQTLGLDLMERTSKNIHYGFQKLYKWVQREFKTLNLENPQMNSSIRRALRVLAERPSLFQNCLDFFAEARERILSDSFQSALTGSTSGGLEDPTLKPIDLTAHDPLRYVGDMLAWIHSATVSEREALEILFVAEGEELAQGLKSGRNAEVWRLVSDDDDGNEQDADFNALRALNELVDRNISGAARVLRQRVEQVIQSNEETIPAYKLAILVNFYLVTFQKVLGTKSRLLELVGALEVEALRQFRGLVRDHIAALQAEFQQTPSDLGPPVFLQDALKQLDAIMRTYDTSLSSSADRESEFEPILTEAFEPFMSGCENMAKSMEPPRSTVFLINCRLAGANALGSFEFTERRLGQLRDKITEEAEKLSEDQHAFFRDQSGLLPLMKSVEVSNAQLQSEELVNASQRLDDFLPSALMDGMDRLKHLQNTKLAREITEKAAARFCDDFEVFEKAVEEADGGNPDPEEPGPLRAAFPRTTTEIRVLLS